jgi:hypothetical protein
VCCAQELLTSLLCSKSLGPFYKMCVQIFASKPYPSIVQLHGAMLRYLGKHNLQEVYSMFGSPDAGKEVWAEFEAKVGAS